MLPQQVSIAEGLPSDLVQPAPLAWYAIQVKGRTEKQVAQILENKGYEMFLPAQRARRRWSDRMKEVEVPLFPSYVFGRFDPKYRLPILTTPNVLTIVGAGKQVIPVADEQIEDIRRVLASGMPVEHCPFLKVGQRVFIESGALAGQAGILTRIKNTWRVVISVDLIRRSIAVEVDREQIRVLEG